MNSTYYTSLSGMLAASFGLQNTSHNVANMQSSGFKRSEVFYSSLGDGNNHSNSGSGVKISRTNTNFSAGNYHETGNPCDLAIIGQGFFIIRLNNGELVYSRNGEFGFNKEGFLFDKHSGGLVQGYNEKGALVPIQQFGPSTQLGKASSHIELSGEFVLVEKKDDALDPRPFKSKYENIKFTLDTVFDNKGKKHTLELEFEPKGIQQHEQANQDGLEWNLIKVSYDGVSLAPSFQSLKFDSQTNGSLEEGYNLINIIVPNNHEVTLSLGNYWSDKDKAVRLNALGSENTNSQIISYKNDGYEEGKLINFSFDENGQITYHYDNQKTFAGSYLALARFNDVENTLIPTNDNLFRAKNEHGRQIGRANKGGFGTLQPQQIESSNVDSTTEFANIVVLQRMFQACSQIMDIDKQLLEELYKK